jgi:hypothetical protein
VVQAPKGCATPYYVSVTGRWVQPAISCRANRAVTAVAFWMGLDGYVYSQGGYKPLKPLPGTVIAATVSFDSTTNEFKMTLTVSGDPKPGEVSRSCVNQFDYPCNGLSAEWIAERPPGPNELAAFSPWNLTMGYPTTTGSPVLNSAGWGCCRFVMGAGWVRAGTHEALRQAGRVVVCQGWRFGQGLRAARALAGAGGLSVGPRPVTGTRYPQSLSRAKAAGQAMSGASHSTGFPSGMLCVAYSLPGNEWRSAPGEATVRCRY